MRVLCVFGEHQYGDPRRGLGTEYAAFIPALRNLGHEVRHFESWHRKRYRDLSDLNERLLIEVESFRPDIMLSVHMEYELWLETLDTIRARGDVAMVSWAADDSWKYREVSRFVGGAYHAMTTTCHQAVGRYRADGIHEVLLTQWAASSASLAEPLPASACRYPVSFVGAAHGNRPALVARLRAVGIEVVCFGHGWPNGPVDAATIPRSMRESVISLNFANSRGENQVKARTFEAPGAGGFLLTGDAADLGDYYRHGKEIIVYRDFGELVGYIRHYLARPRERDAIARAGYERTRAEHTYERRLARVVDFVCAAKARSGQPPSAPSFERAKQQHALTPSLRLLRAGLTSAGRAIYGPDRGSRAARRLLFELCWRVAGRHCFTSAGWPGRMFPRD